MAQGIAFDAWFLTLPREEMLRRLETLVAIGGEMGLEVTADPDTHFSVLALRGETEDATEIALQRIFSRPVSTRPDWRDTLAQAQYATIVDDPRVRQAMLRWEEEEALLRGNVQAYFQDMQAAN